MAPAYSIGREKRGKWMNTNPETKKIGPGSYEASTMFNSTAPSENLDPRAMKYSENKPVFWKSSKRFKRPSGLTKVAPNTYDPRPVKPSAPIHSFGYKFDSLRPGSAMPSLGPGKYDPLYTQKEVTKKVSFPKDKKMRPQSSNPTPGPGRYNSQKNLKKISGKQKDRYSSLKGTMGFRSQKRFAKNTNNWQPAPDAYNVENHTIEYQLKVKMDSSIRNTDVGKETNKYKYFDNNVPGPGSYNPLVEPVKEGKPQFSFGHSKRSKMGKDHSKNGASKNVRNDAIARIRMRENKLKRF